MIVIVLALIPTFRQFSEVFELLSNYAKSDLLKMAFKACDLKLLFDRRGPLGSGWHVARCGRAGDAMQTDRE